MRTYLDGLVHPLARQDALTAARHRAFIAPRLVAAVAALIALPVYLALRGAPDELELAVFAWLVAPLLLAFFLSQTGRYETAHVLSALALTCLVTALACASGGINSFAAIWLVVIPIEAALSASRRVVALAAIFSLTGAAILLSGGAAGLVPQPQGDKSALIACAVVAAALYATALALGTESIARKSLRLHHASEERYRLLARNMTDVITRHGAKGAVLFASPAAEGLFGGTPEALLGHGLFDRVHVADRPAYLTALSNTASRGEPGSLEFRIRRDGAPGNFVWVEMRCRPLESGPGEPQEVVAVLRDISERKAQELAIEQARAESERANAHKSRFLATMSHELRTPLNAIIGFSEMLTNDGIAIDPTRRHEYARLINDSGRHLLSVVNGILDMSKMEAGNFEITPEPFAPAQAIGSCCGILALKARDNAVELKTHIPADLPDIVADRRALNQILLNLVSNAIKFTNAGGCVTVSAAREDAYLAVIVEDTGVGIGEDDLPRLGEAFFQARASYDRRHDGTGLGLSIVKALVRLHGGEMKIRSRLGAGTRVHVRLPLDCEKKVTAAPTILPERKRETGSISILSEEVRKRA